MYALCVDKTWALGSIGRYFRSSLTAIQARNATIVRVFVDSDDQLINKHVLEEARDQAAFGVDAHIIPRATHRNLAAKRGLPEALGFTIFAHKVFIHWGVGDVAQGVLIEGE